MAGSLFNPATRYKRRGTRKFLMGAKSSLIAELFTALGLPDFSRSVPRPQENGFLVGALHLDAVRFNAGIVFQGLMNDAAIEGI